MTDDLDKRVFSAQSAWDKSGKKPVIPLPASTLIIARDNPKKKSIELFMQERSPDAPFVGGAFVFPGGKVDKKDHTLTPYVCEHFSDTQANETLGTDMDGLHYWVAAVRECFEESGILLADKHQGDPLNFSHASTHDRFSDYRQQLLNKSMSFSELCEKEQLKLLPQNIHYFSRWVTPSFVPMRFDTRFFITVMPEHQKGIEDGYECISSVWLSPDELIEKHAEKELKLVFPTTQSIYALQGFKSVMELMHCIENRAPFPTEAGEWGEMDGVTQVLMPGQNR